MPVNSIMQTERIRIEFDRTCTYLLSSEPSPFNSSAKQSFLEIAKTLQATGIGIGIVEAEYNASGELVSGTFDFTHGLARRSYIFDPGYSLPSDEPHESGYAAINSDWYHVWTDWN